MTTMPKKLILLILALLLSYPFLLPQRSEASTDSNLAIFFSNDNHGETEPCG